MSTTPIIQQVYEEYLDHFGEPDHSLVFDDGKSVPGFPRRVDVVVWDPDEDCDITTFATLGMSDVPMPGEDYRAELHFAIRLNLDEQQRHSVARFLANLVMFPFQTGEALDWWHTLSQPGDIPLSKTTDCVLLHPRFIEDGWDTISTEQFDIHLLNVIPITKEECDLGEIDAILDSLEEKDIFAPR